jgi:hypothetical protein
LFCFGDAILVLMSEQLMDQKTIFFGVAALIFALFHLARIFGDGPVIVGD